MNKKGFVTVYNNRDVFSCLQSFEKYSHSFVWLVRTLMRWALSSCTYTLFTLLTILITHSALLYCNPITKLVLLTSPFFNMSIFSVCCKHVRLEFTTSVWLIGASCPSLMSQGQCFLSVTHPQSSSSSSFFFFHTFPREKAIPRMKEEKNNMSPCP